MKLDKMQFAKVIAYVSNLVQRQNIDDTDLDMLDQIIDIDVPVSDPSRVSPEALEALLAFMAAGTQKIEAVKSFRILTGVGLKEAKDAVERYWYKRPNTSDMLKKIEKQQDEIYNKNPTGDYLLDGLSLEQLAKVKEFIQSFT